MAKFVIEHYELHRVTHTVTADNVAEAISLLYAGKGRRSESDLAPLDIADHPILGILPDNWDAAVSLKDRKTYAEVVTALTGAHDIAVDEFIPEIISIAEL